MATTETWKSASGEKQSRTDWHNITVWGKLAEIVMQFVKKGSHVYIEGSLQHREVTGQNGQKQFFTSIKADEMQMLGGGKDRPHTQTAAAPAAAATYDDYSDVPL